MSSGTRKNAANIGFEIESTLVTTTEVVEPNFSYHSRSLARTASMESNRMSIPPAVTERVLIVG